MLLEVGRTGRPPALCWPLTPRQRLAACERALRCCHILWFPTRAAAPRLLRASTCHVQLRPHGNASAAVQLSLRIRLPCATQHLPGISACISSCSVPEGASNPFHLAWRKLLSGCAHTSPPKPFTPGYLPTTKPPAPSISLGSHKFTCAIEVSMGWVLT